MVREKEKERNDKINDVGGSSSMCLIDRDSGLIWEMGLCRSLPPYAVPLCNAS